MTLITNELPRVFNFSGGLTSAYMTLTYYRPGDIVIFSDVSREHPKTYKFINDFEAYEGIPVTRVNAFGICNDQYREMLARKKFKVLPNRVKRFCTDTLKIKPAKRYLRSIGIREFENFIGFRFDEAPRVLNRKFVFKKVHDRYPLYEDRIIKPFINQYWSQKPYTLEIPPILGNCTLCYLKGKNAIMAILASYPELADEWIEDEELSEIENGKGNGRTYFPKVTIRQLRDLAQNNLFSNIDINQVAPAYNCACTT